MQCVLLFPPGVRSCLMIFLLSRSQTYKKAPFVSLEINFLRRLLNPMQGHLCYWVSRYPDPQSTKGIFLRPANNVFRRFWKRMEGALISLGVLYLSSQTYKRHPRQAYNQLLNEIFKNNGRGTDVTGCRVTQIPNLQKASSSGLQPTSKNFFKTMEGGLILLGALRSESQHYKRVLHQGQHQL
jgi:hypothetical protein